MKNYNEQRLPDNANVSHRAYDIITALIFGVVVTLGIVFMVRLFFF